MTVGLAAPFSRPARSAVTLAALVFGLTGVVLGTSLNTSIHKINNSAFHGLGQLEVGLNGRTNTLSPGQEAAVRAAIRAQPGTLHYVAESDLTYSGTRSGPRSVVSEAVGNPRPTVSFRIAGQPGLAVMAYAYNGDSSWLGWSLVSGRWYSGPGQIDVSTDFTADTGLTVGDRVRLTVNGKPVTMRIVGEVFVPTEVPTMWVSWQTLGGAATGLTANQYDIALTPGTSTQAYIDALQRTLGSDIGVSAPSGIDTFAGLDLPLFQWLTVLVGVLAGLGVLNTALMATRERVHDLGVFKAVGMTPPQTIAMVICWVIAPAVIAAAIALPAGLIAQDALVRQLAPGNVLPGIFVHVLGGAGLLLLALAGLVIAVAGALGPAIWAVASKTTTALRAE